MTMAIPNESLPPIPIAELPAVLRLNTGPRVTARELAVSHEGLMDRPRPLSRVTALLSPQDSHWRHEVQAVVGEAVTEFASFIEGDATRVDFTELWRRDASLLFDDGEHGGKGLRHLTDQLRDLGGACEPRHTIRRDEGPTGTMVTAGRLQVPGQQEGRECYFIESTVSPSIDDDESAARRFEIIAADHPNVLAVINRYSYDEWLQVQKILNHMDLHPDVRSEVFAHASRLTAPDAKMLDTLVQHTVQAYEEVEAAKAAVDETAHEVYMGAAATAAALFAAASHEKVLV